MRPFDRAIDGVGTRVAVYGAKIAVSNISTSDPDKLFMGRIVRLDDDMISPIEFDDFIENSIVPVDKAGHGSYISENDMFVVEESDNKNSPNFQPSSFGGAIKDIVAELLVTGLSKTDSNRVNVVIEDLKSKVGEDWEEQVRNAIEPEAAAEIFISLIKELEKQEQERLQFGSVQTPSAPTTSRRGRPRKEKTPEPKPMPTTPEVSDVQNEDDLSALLDDLLNL
jgi:hypothetical protein